MAVATDIVIHPRVLRRHPDVAKEDVVAALGNAVAIVNRTYEPPDVYAAAGADRKGCMPEVLGVELDDGRFLVYRAMKLTAKTSRELGLG